MKKITLCFTLVLSLVFLSVKKDKSGVTLQEVIVKAPFDMPAIKIPDFSKCVEFSIVDFGAVRGDKEKTSQAINKAIAKANKAGGGTVVILQGEWLTKKIHFKSNEVSFSKRTFF